MTRRLDAQTDLSVLFADHCEITLSGSAEVPRVKWIHVASTGQYLGHWQGKFDLTPEVFESFVRNLRAHPQYSRGAIEVGGKTIQAGTKPTIQFDFEHASEQASTAGSIPALGAPAPAWVLDVETRLGAKGTTELWALAQLGETIRGYIARNEYRQTSIAFGMEARDYRTGKPIGPTLSSIAFTNDPFLRNLEAIAASRRAGQAPINQLQQTASGVAPLDSPDGDHNMSAEALKAAENLRTRLCTALKVRTLANDDELVDAATGAAAGADDAKTLMEGTGEVDIPAAKAAIETLRGKAAELESALAEINGILQANGAADQTVAEQDVAAVMSANNWDSMPAMKPALFARRAQLVSETLTGTEALKGRKTLAVGQVMAGTSTARESFLAEYGIKKPGEGSPVDVATLTRSLVATKGGVQVTAPPAPPAQFSVRPAAAAVAPLAIEPRGAEGSVVDLRQVKGRNPTEKCIQHLKNTDPNFAKLTWQAQCSAAVTFRASHEVLTA